MIRSLRLTMPLILMMLCSTAYAANREDQIKKDVAGEGSCAVVSMSVEQCQHLALTRARASAIEQAAGIRVTESTVITNMRLAVEFLKTYAKGYIRKEGTPEWTQAIYQPDMSKPGIVEYKVKIKADVYVPEKKNKATKLTVMLNKETFNTGDNAEITIKTSHKADIAIFNIRADDKVVMLYPNQFMKDNSLDAGQTLIFPGKKMPLRLTLDTLPNHEADSEAIFVVATDPARETNFMHEFEEGAPMAITKFFEEYSEIADYSEDKMIAYEVRNEKK